MTSSGKKPRALSLWIAVALAFLLLIAAWTALIMIARQNPVERVPPEKSSTEVREQGEP